jgi:hypothetical protein
VQQRAVGQRVHRHGGTGAAGGGRRGLPAQSVVQTQTSTRRESVEHSLPTDKLEHDGGSV